MKEEDIFSTLMTLSRTIRKDRMTTGPTGIASTHCLTTRTRTAVGTRFTCPNHMAATSSAGLPLKSHIKLRQATTPRISRTCAWRTSCLQTRWRICLSKSVVWDGRRFD
eukprot:Rmarinus@m.7387